MTTDFDALADGPLAALLTGVEENRKKAMKSFQIGMLVAGGLALACLLIPIPFIWRVVIGAVIFIGGWVIAGGSLSKAGRALKQPALEAMSAARGLSYSPERFAADGFQQLSRIFGSGSQNFTDRFGGTEGDHPFAFYEAALTRRQGKSTRTVFRGMVHALQRAPLQGETMIVPDKGLFNFVPPRMGTERVKFEDDPDFEKGFEVYATRPEEARALLNPVVRNQLKVWRQAGGITAYLGGETVAIAFSDPQDRFEAGTMTKSIPARDRVRKMYDEMQAGLARMREVRQTLG